MSNEITFPPTPGDGAKITGATIFTEQGAIDVEFDEPITLHISEGKTPDVVITLPEEDDA